jgi:hypothetical protein
VAAAADEVHAMTVIAARVATARVAHVAMDLVDHGATARVDHGAMLDTRNAVEAKSDLNLPASPLPASSILTTPSSRCWARRCARAK